jgi:hypothetical protein
MPFETKYFFEYTITDSRCINRFFIFFIFPGAAAAAAAAAAAKCD